MEISQLFYQLVGKVGKYALVAVILLLAGQHWGVVNLEKINPSLDDFLFLYLIINGTLATPFIYLERKGRVAPGKFCPKCDSPLKVVIDYECPNCGRIIFKKEGV